MKQLICEMCGSTDLLKQDGVFVCQICGTKYSVEEAKKMMIEGTVDVSGSTVKVDNTDQIKNFIEMAKSAYDADNKGEAEAYCNRIIEIDPQNYEAWLIKGKAAGWQSTLARIRIDESVQCFSKAIDYAPEEVISDLKEDISNETTELSKALMRLCCNNFVNYQSKDNVDTIKSCGLMILNYSLQLILKCGTVISNFKSEIAGLISHSATAGYRTVEGNYIKEKLPDKYTFDKFIEGADYVSTLIAYAIDYAGEEDLDLNIFLYKELININNDCINACSWKWEYVDWDPVTLHDPHVIADYQREVEQMILSNGGIPDKAGHGAYAKEFSLTSTAVAARRNNNDSFNKKINEYRKLIQKKKEDERKRKLQEQQDRNKTYWAEHAEEKLQLESERSNLENELNQLKTQATPFDKEIATLKKERDGEVPSEKEKETVLSEISRLRKEQGQLGLFKGKEKKAIQDQINELNSRLTTIGDSIEAERKEQQKSRNAKIREIEERAKPIKDKIIVAQKRINEINTELTKNR